MQNASARRPVSRVLSASRRYGTVIPLGHASLRASRDQPGRRGERPPDRFRGENPRNTSCRPYSVLLPVGFALPPPLPEARCALTAPFHPCPQAPTRLPGRMRVGGLFSVALSLGSPPPAVSRHRSFVEPGLSSTASAVSGLAAATVRPSGDTETEPGPCPRQAVIWIGPYSLCRQPMSVISMLEDCRPGSGI
jgi:hypothetical protein